MDDDAAFALMLMAILEREPALELVGVATNGHDAVSACDSGEVDLVLMDLDMPVLDGVEATRRIRGRSARTRIVVVTGEEPTRARAAIRAGADAFVSKLQAPDALVATLKSLTALDARTHDAA